jgi:GAF domain-containing protein
MPARAAALLSSDEVAFIGRGLSTLVASRDARLRPSVMRAMGSTITPDGGCVTVYLSRLQAQQLLSDLASCARIAVSFSEPASHRTLQLKARALRLRETTPQDQSVIAHYRAGMYRAVGEVGLGPNFVDAMLAADLDALVAVEFSPEEAFDQTPGPRAGHALGSPTAATSPVAPGTSGLPSTHTATPTAPAPTDELGLREGAPTLTGIRASLEGVIPAAMATCASDGTPNVALLSQVFYVDDANVALSFQFFNTTRRNILANPLATLLLLDPNTAAFHRLHLRYLRTETTGPLFERMKAQLAGIASHSGMEGVFRLLGSDLYAVERLEAVAGRPLPAPPPRCALLPGLRAASEVLAHCNGLEALLTATLEQVARLTDTAHAMVLLWDAASERLYTVASRGYATSGIGSEVELGQGVIGVAARERTPVRIGHMTSASLYSHAVRRSLSAEPEGLALATDIPYPGLAQPHSQIAVPLLSGARLVGVVFAESELDLRFGYEEEDALVALAGQLAAAIDATQIAASEEPFGPTGPAARSAAAVVRLNGAPAVGAPMQVRRYRSNDSIFIDDTYLIKGVAGAILWKLLGDYTHAGRTEFSNRELRLDPSIGLPDVSDNLEARLLLLQRRLAEHGADLRIERTGRGRFHLAVARAVVLNEVAN